MTARQWPPTPFYACSRRGLHPNLPPVEAHPSQAHAKHQAFASTRWTTIRACSGDGTAAQAAREILCRDYWYPVYAYIKRAGHKSHDAEDRTQDFIEYILSKSWLEQADQTRGRFRAFLLASLDNFLRDHHAKSQAGKRAGGYRHVPLDMATAESRHALSEQGERSPAQVYETEWASVIVNIAWRRLEAEYVDAGKQHHFEHLKVFLASDGDAAQHQTAAKVLNLSVQNIRVCIHRLRKRYSETLREEISRTVKEPADVAAEMAHLREVFAAKVVAAA